MDSVMSSMTSWSHDMLISHEIRTSLIGILQMIDKIDVSGCNEEHHKLRLIKKAAIPLNLLVENTLLNDKITKKTKEFSVSSYNLYEVITSTIQPYEFLAKEKGLSFNLKFNGYFNEKLVGHSFIISTVLKNLLSNAIKYTEKGMIEVCISAERIDNKYNLTFAVSDTGSGIEEAALEKLLDAYITLDNGNSDNIQVGLGLHLCFQMLEITGSKLIVSSVLDKGTKFSFSLTEEVLPDECYSMRKKRVLVIEDDEIVSEIESEFMSVHGVLVDVASTGSRAIQLMKCNEYDVILTDYYLTDTTGGDLIKYIRHKVVYSPLIICITGIEDTRQINELYDLGVSRVLLKPIDLNCLLDIIEEKEVDFV